MHITEILSSHVEPGAQLVDLTTPAADLSSHARLAPELRITRHTALADVHGAQVAVVMQQLSADERLTLAVNGLATKVVHIVFVADARAIFAHGLLDDAARNGWEVASLHATGHATFRLAVVLIRGVADATRPSLRVLNEWRVGQWIQREQDHELARLAARVEKAEAQRDAARRELDERVAELSKIRSALVDSTRDAKTNADRASRALVKLEKARSGVPFRIARATRVALRDAATAPWTLPSRFVAVLRGPDEVIDELRGQPTGKRR